MSINIDELLTEAGEALQNEIKAVREHPKREVLSNPRPETEFGEHSYRFDCQNPSFQYVESLTLISQDPPVPGTVEKVDEKSIIINFEKDPQQPFLSAEVEWVNDYVLERTLEQLEILENQPEGRGLERLEEIFNTPGMAQDDAIDPETGEVIAPEIAHDGYRNPAQLDAITKAMRNRVSYVWGPPGTGKTATLGYIIANYLNEGKRVLFASNTNRAVDVGLLSALAALQELRMPVQPEKLTRFGESALEHAQLEELNFEQQLDKRRQQAVQEMQLETQKGSRDDVRRKMLSDMIANLNKQGKKVPPKLEHELEQLNLGHDEAAEEAAEKELENLPYRELRKRKLVATTLARICTAELLTHSSFDAVVIDEASMASIPYLLVLAAKSSKHIIFAGDPMQLPPIATTGSIKHRNFLERDVYTLASGAESMTELFAWKDQNPEITCFFDTQYRLEQDLAEVISEVFYDGRLRSGKALPKKTGQATLEMPAEEEEVKKSDISVHLVDTSKFGSYIETQKSEAGKSGGFRPFNHVHQELTIELVRRLMLREQTPPGEIGIIVPFRSVVWNYRKALREKGYGDVEVGTIHTYQGREKEAIIFDTVMSGLGRNEPRRHFSVRPFDETKNGLSVPRLLNVAFSRAKTNMVVLADMQHVQRIYRGKFLGTLLQRLKDVG